MGPDGYLNRRSPGRGFPKPRRWLSLEKRANSEDPAGIPDLPQFVLCFSEAWGSARASLLGPHLGQYLRGWGAGLALGAGRAGALASWLGARTSPNPSVPSRSDRWAGWTGHDRLLSDVDAEITTMMQTITNVPWAFPRRPATRGGRGRGLLCLTQARSFFPSR